MKFALFFMAEYCHMVIGAALIAALYFGGYQIPWMPRPVLEANAGLALSIKLVLMVIFGIGIAAAFFRRAKTEKGKFGDGRDREPGLMGGIFSVIAVGALAALFFKPWAIGPETASLVATLFQVMVFVSA